MEFKKYIEFSELIEKLKEEKQELYKQIKIKEEEIKNAQIERFSSDLNKCKGNYVIIKNNKPENTQWDDLGTDFILMYIEDVEIVMSRVVFKGQYFEFFEESGFNYNIENRFMINPMCMDMFDIKILTKEEYQKTIKEELIKRDLIL